jgi:hypothetical protein
MSRIEFGYKLKCDINYFLSQQFSYLETLAFTLIYLNIINIKDLKNQYILFRKVTNFFVQ